MRNIGKKYHSQIIRAYEFLFTVLAVVLVVTIHLHVALSGTLGVELHGASLATVSFRPVVDSIHVLIARVLRTESSGARLALPMNVVIHVVIYSIPTVEAICAAIAFIHCCDDGECWMLISESGQD